MSRSMLVGSVLVAVLASVPSSVNAQRESRDHDSRSRRAEGRVNDGRHYTTERYRHGPPVVERRAYVAPRIIERYAPRTLAIESWPFPGHRGVRFQRFPVRYVTVYFDPRSEEYFDSYRPGLREVEVCESGGRYYYREDRDERYYQDRHYRRYDRDRDDR